MFWPVCEYVCACKSACVNSYRFNVCVGDAEILRSQNAARFNKIE